MRMPIQMHAYKRHVKRLLIGPGTVESAAYTRDVVCPEEKAWVSPSSFLPGQLEKVSGAPSESSIEVEIAAATAREVVHAATIAYHVRDAVLIDGSIYSGRWKHFISHRSALSSLPSDPIHIGEAGLASSCFGTRYFGHWLRDDCAQYILAQEYGQPLCVRQPTYSVDHQQKYGRYFHQDWTPIDRARIDHLVVFQDFSQNKFKQARYKLLKAQIRAHFAGTPCRKNVFLRRGQTGVMRTIRNEGEIVDALIKRDFKIVDLESDSLETILRTLVDAKIVVSMEGSHISHCCFTVPDQSGLIVLQPADRFTGVHRGWAECMSVRFGFVVGGKVEGGYYFSTSDILRTIDLMQKNIEARDPVGPDLQVAS